MLVSEGFQKFAGIPGGMLRISESLMAQQISANRCKNRSIQVKDKLIDDKDDFEFELTTKALFINGVNQAERFFKKYKKLYKKITRKELKTSFIIIYQ